MTFEAYQKQAVETAIYGAGNTIVYPALGLANEAGEVLGKIKKVLRDNNGDFDEESCEKIAMEIGDTLWYIAALARDINIPLEYIAEKNLEKLRSRRERGVIGGSGDTR